MRITTDNSYFVLGVGLDPPVERETHRRGGVLDSLWGAENLEYHAHP